MFKSSTTVCSAVHGYVILIRQRYVLHMDEDIERLKQINEMVQMLGEADQRRVFKIVKVFLER